MQIFVRHKTTYNYEHYVKSTFQHLRMMPKNNNSQQIVQWRIDMDHDCQLRRGEDAYGNVLHRTTIDNIHGSVTATAEGLVNTINTYGILTGVTERFPPILYMRSSPQTIAGDELKEFVFSNTKGSQKNLERLHILLRVIYESMTFDINATDVATTAIDAFSNRKGVCQDFAHIFVSGAQSIGVPARYVSGYLLRRDTTEQCAGHAWAEAYVDGLGWVGFDPANGVCPDDHYIRIAAGPHYDAVAPIRGERVGGGKENLNVKLLVTDVFTSREEAHQQ